MPAATLSIAAVQHASLDRAAGELMTNATRLAVAGCAAEARQALGLLLQDGPWRLPAHGALVHQLQGLLPLVSLLADTSCPALGDQPGIARDGLVAWAQRAARDRVQVLARPTSQQLRPAGADWSPAFLATLPQRRGKDVDPRPHVAFGAFCADAEFVLKARVLEQFATPVDAAAQTLNQLLERLGARGAGAGAISIAPAARGIDTLDVARAVAGYTRATGFGGTFLESVIYQLSVLLLVATGRAPAAQEVARAWLATDKRACELLLDLAPVASVGRFLRAGELGQAAQVDAQAAREWLVVLQTRQAKAPAKRAADAPAASRLQSGKALLATLKASDLGALPWMKLAVPGDGEEAWAAVVPVADRKRLWTAARALVAQTGRWPIVSTLWSGNAGDADDLADDLFSRFPYEQGAARDDVSPRSFIATAASLDAGAFVARLAERELPMKLQHQVQFWRDQLSAAGVPDDGFDAALAACNGDRLFVERWLAAQEAKHGKVDPGHGRQPGFDPGNALLVLLPTPHGENALAYMHWFGIDRGSADGFIGLLRAWRERHGAHLWAHYGTMLEFVVDKPPQDFETALALAREHDLAAPCTLILPGIALRHYAAGLVGHGEWFLHERP